MRITSRMDLKQLASLISPDATRADAAIVRAELVREGYAGHDTKLLKEDVWMSIAYQSQTA